MNTEDILKTIDLYSNFMVIGHENPDGDCLGSQMAMDAFLKRLEKEVTLYSAGPFRKPEIASWEPHFLTELPDSGSIPEETLVIIVDCSTFDRTGLDVKSLERPVMVIDHHASGSAEGDYRYIDSVSPSTTLLIQTLIEACLKKTSKEEADYIFYGFATDTGFFKFLEKGQSKVFESVARLCESGINPRKTFERISGGKNLNSQKFIARIIERAEEHFNGKLLISHEFVQDYEDFDLETRDSGTLYSILQSIDRCEVIILIKEMEENRVSVSFRSATELNVGKIAQDLGGGGHAKASGCTMEESVEKTKEKLLDIFTEYF